ncbi:hypothetical protein L7F22_061273 [Adiantum nelumboides]|nr:hypothetical protein [Adiantum nelumboides]
MHVRITGVKDNGNVEEEVKGLSQRLGILEPLPRRSAPKFTYGQDNVENTDAYTYLGVVFTGPKFALKKAADNRLSRAYAALGGLERMCSQVQFQEPRTKLWLFDTLVTSAMLYGVQVWGPSVDQDSWRAMERPLISMISRMIRAKASVPHAIIRAEVAAPPIEIEGLTKSVSFIHGIWNTDRCRYTRLALESSRQLALKGDTSCWSSNGPRYVFSVLNYVKLQRRPFEHPSASRITIRLALKLLVKTYDLSASFNANRLTIRVVDECSKDPRCVFSALNCVKLQNEPFEHTLVSRITVRLAVELVSKPYDLPTNSNANRLTIRFVDGCLEGLRRVFSVLNCVKLQRGSSEHPSASHITIRFALEFADKPYDLPVSSNAKHITKWLADGCSKVSRCVFSALECVKLQRGSFEHPSANRITIRFALEFAGKRYDLSTKFNASRLTIRLADGCSKDSRCVFSALNCVKLQRGSSEYTSASRIIIRFAIELADKPHDLSHTSVSRIIVRLALEFVSKPYDLSASSNANRLTIRFVDGCSEGPRCVFSVLNCVKLQRGPSEHPSASRITIRLALELASKPYDLPVSFNAKRITKRLADGCSKVSRCVFSGLDCVKLQRGSFEHPSANRITIRFALDLAGKPYDLSTKFNASRFTIRLADVCSKDPRCVFSALNCVKLQRGSSEHTSTSRITIRFALELTDKAYNLSAISNASRITKRLIDGCSEDPRCVFSALNCVKLQRGSFEHSSVSRITIRIALKFVDKPYDLSLDGKPYDLPANSNANRLTIRIADGCSEGPRCILNCVKLQRRTSEHPSASRINIRLALELADKPYDLPASSNVSRLTIRLVDGCSEVPRYVFSALNCVKLQRRPSELTSASRITIRFALKLAGKPYDLSASFNANRITKRFVDECSKCPRCVFSALYCVKLQRGSFEHTSTIRITIRLALKFAGKPYDLPASSNAIRLTIRLADGCSEDPRCVFSALDYVKPQRGPSEHSSTSRMFADVCSEGPRCVFSALDCVKLQRESSEHSSVSRITIRFALELAGKAYDLLASANASRITKRIVDGCSEGSRCVFSALDCVKLQRGSFEHTSASCITIRLVLELADKSYDFPASSNASRLTIQLADGCSEGSRCVFSVLDCVKLQRGPSEHSSASRIIIRLALEFADKSYDLSINFNASRITKRLADECSESPRCVFSALEF